jgi:hypothetical protein
MNAALVSGIRSLLNEEPPALTHALAEVDTEATADLNTLAQLFQQIASLGDHERKLAIRMMHVVAQYAQDKASPSGWGDL